MLFAAGFGTRMGALTKDRPKPLVPVAGRALLDHALALTEVAGIQRRVINTHYHADQIADHVAGRSDILLSHETGLILETGGGLRNALPLLGSDPVLTLNTDAVWRGPNPLTMLQAAWRPDEMDALLLCLPRAQAIGHKGNGDFLIGPDGRLTRGAGVVYSGAQIIKTDSLNAIPETAFSLNLVWERMRENGRLFGIDHTGHWCDVGSPEGITQAENMLAQTDV